MTRPLTNLQVELLNTFNYGIDEQQLAEVKQLLTNYFAQKITDGMDQLFEEKSWDDSKLEEWSNEHMRTPHKRG